MECIRMAGKPVAEAYRADITARVAAAKAQGKTVTLAIVTVGEDPASFVYRGRLLKTAESVGASNVCVELPETAVTADVLAALDKLNRDPAITGILPMMPMPAHIDSRAVGAALAPAKDMDCLHPANMGALFLGEGRWAACTPRACLATLKHYGIALAGKRAVVLGRSNVVGKPVALLLLQENCTVTLCHSHTRDLPALLREADVVVAAIGRADFVQPDMVKDGVVLVDVGINVTDRGLRGDIDPAAAAKASAYTPVPGGIGAVSNMMMMDALTRNL